MMHLEEIDLQNLYFVRLNPGDDMLVSLREAVEKLDIKNGIILGGVGSTSSYHFHVVSTGINPPEEIYTRGKAPADIVSLSGMILNGKVHAHISYSNDRIAYGGHLEVGTTVLTFAVVTLAKIKNEIRDWDLIGNIDSILAEKSRSSVPGT